MKKAVAIKYDDALPAPFVIAKGKHELADRLTQIARENNVEVVKAFELTETLFEFEIGTFIPEEMYEIIAKLLAYVFEVRNVR